MMEVIILSAKLTCIVVVLSVFLIGISSAVTISITASNSGKYVAMEHYYGANENANYKAEGSGEVNLDSAGISISENSRYSGEFKYEYNDEEGNGGFGVRGNGDEIALKSNHIARSNDYAIAKVHIMYSNFNEGSIDESLNFNVNNNAGELERKMVDKYVGESEGMYEVAAMKSESGGNGGNTKIVKVIGGGDGIGEGDEELPLPPGDHDYVMVVEGSVKITKSAKDLTPEDIVYKKAINGNKVFSYGILMTVGAALGDLSTQTDGGKNSNYDVNPVETWGGGYAIYNGTSWKCCWYNEYTSQWECEVWDDYPWCLLWR